MFPVANTDPGAVTIRCAVAGNVGLSLGGQTGYCTGKSLSVPDGIKCRRNGTGGVGLRVLFPADYQHFVKHAGTNQMVSADSYGAPGGSTGCKFYDRFHGSTGAIHTPAIYIVYSFKMVHVTDDDGIYVLHLQVSIVECRNNGLVDKFLSVHVGTMALVKCLSGSDYCNSFSHCSSSYFS